MVPETRQRYSLQKKISHSPQCRGILVKEQKFYSGKLMVIVVFSKDNSQAELILLKWWQ
jgi:hypothetical protein